MVKERKNYAAWSEKYGRWSIKIQRNGQRRTFYSSIPGKRGKLDAERKADTWLNNGMLKDGIRFDDLAASFVDTVSTTNGTENKTTITTIINHWLLTRWSGRRVDTLTNADYDAVIAAAAAAGKAKGTLQRIRSVINLIAKYARRAKIDMERPDDLPLPDVPPTAARRILQPNDLQKLFSEPDNSRYLYAFRLCAVLGLRRGELLALQWQDINNGVLTVSRAYNGRLELTACKTAAARREIVLPLIARRIIDAQADFLRRQGIISPYIFPDRAGNITNPQTLCFQWRSYQRRHDMPEITFHELRHTMISITKNALPLTALKSVVGHTPQMNTIGVYGHLIDGERQAAANVIDNVFASIIK